MMQYPFKSAFRHVNLTKCRSALHYRSLATQAKIKKEGDISSVFVSLSNATPDPLPERFVDLKHELLGGRKGSQDIVASWERLLERLEGENKVIVAQGSDIIPQIDFKDLGSSSQDFRDAVRKRGVAVIRNVVPKDEARRYKDDIEDYVKANPQTKGFPSDAPAVFELYWSPPQIRARSHRNLLKAQHFLMSLWHSSFPLAQISTAHPLCYADRLRIRQAGDIGFALGPHIDGGSVERWERNGYGIGGVYDKIFEGKWEDYDPWESSTRIPAVSDLYNGAGGCSMFRMFQGWLSMSTTGPGEGTLMVNPLLKLATAYFLLRPLFESIHERSIADEKKYRSDCNDVRNWRLQSELTSELHGAQMGHAQELSDTLHPHLELSKTMVHIPKINPGDYVVWHCDTIHAVDAIHHGVSDSSVMYIPVCPVTETNAQYVAAQRDAFLKGFPPPDLPGGNGESDHVGRATPGDLMSQASAGGMALMGISSLEVPSATERLGAREAVIRANEILGWSVTKSG